MKRDDTLWKSILENVFDDFLRFFFTDAEKLFDIQKGFQFLDKELEQLFPSVDMEAPKFVDKLVKVYTKEGGEEWLLIHIEVQGYKDVLFAKRMFTYFYRIIDKYHKPVSAIAILTDKSRNFHPDCYTYDCLGTSLTYRFATYKIADQQESELLENDNPFAVVVLTVLLALKQKKLTDAVLLHLKLKLMRNLLKRKIPASKVRSLLNFLKFYIRFEDQENCNKFEEISEFENKKAMGIEEFILDRAEKQGIAKGHEEAKLTFVKNLLLNTDFTTVKISTLADVTPAFVRKVKKSLNKEGR